jgi:hypothetical protein
MCRGLEAAGFFTLGAGNFLRFAKSAKYFTTKVFLKCIEYFFTKNTHKAQSIFLNQIRLKIRTQSNAFWHVNVRNRIISL